MKLLCLLGRHDAVNDLTNWKHGYFQSECARCGAPMRYYSGSWELASKRKRKHGD